MLDSSETAVLKESFICWDITPRNPKQVKEDEMGRAWSTNGGEEKCI
jgi:hypothetical protein